jgi:predicted membrane protein
MQQHLHVSRNKYKQNKRVKIHVSGVVYSGEDT